MQIDYIREFIKLADNLSFSITAKSSYVTQSALSKHIAALEKELGYRLFVRNNHRVSLTQTGRILRDRMVEALQKYDQAIAEATKAHNGFESTLKIGYLYEATRDFFLQACAELRARTCNLGIETMAYEAEDVLTAINRGMIDIGITVLPNDIDFSEYDIWEIRKEKFLIAVSNTNRLSKKSIVSFHDLKNIDILFPNPNVFPELSSYLHRKLKGTIIEQNAVESAYSSKSIEPFLVMYNGAALIMQHSLTEMSPAFKFLEIEGVNLNVTLAIIWNKHKNMAIIDEFVACVENALPPPNSQSFQVFILIMTAKDLSQLL